MSETWSNWAGDQHCAPEWIVSPVGEEEIQEIVAGAAARGQSVRAVGSGHSFTDIACTEGVLVDLSRMQRLLAVDSGSGLVTVEAGVKLHALGAMLAEHGLALENQGDIDAQAIAGALATATHGTGAKFPNLAAPVRGMRLIRAGGDVVEIDGSDPELLRAARVSLGALGIASAVTLQTIPIYTLHRRDEPRPLSETLAELDAHVEENDHFEFFVFPYTATALTRSTRRSEEPPDPTPEWRRRIHEDLIENRVLSMICRAGRLRPRSVPRLNRLMTAAMSASHVQDHAYRVYATTRNVRFTEMEYAIPREHGREAVERVLALIERNRLPILFPLEVRFAAGDDALLSTAHERDTCYIAVHQFSGMEFESFFRGVEEIMDAYGGRPHWGKRHYQRAATLRERYPEWDRFQSVRSRLDPEGRFANDYTRRVLGPIGAPDSQA